MKKTLLFILFVLLGVGIFDSVFSRILEKTFNNRFDNAFYSTYSSSAEIAIIGASRAIHHYNPQIISDSLNCSVHVFGSGGQNIYFHYAILHSLISNSYQKPKIVILELSNIDINNTPKWNTEKLPVLYPYYKTDSVVQDLLFDVLDKKERIIVRYSSLYRHNSNLLYYLQLKYLNSNEDNNGFIPKNNIWNEPIKLLETKDDIAIDANKLRYLIKFIDLCKKENIRLCFAVSPHYRIVPTEKWKETIKDLSNNYQIIMIDHEQDSFFLEHRELFNEPFHLNGSGANIYSQLIAQELVRVLNQ